MTPKKILIVAGEPSGDLHASNLVKDLKTLRPNLTFFGIGGVLSKKAGVDIVFDITPLALVGVVEVLKNIFTVGRAYKDILRKVDSENPDLAILVDYPGFNLRLAKALKKRSIPVIYYISPQVWAWGRDRINIIKRRVKKILVFFKFEEELYKTYGIDAEFVGHPLLDTVKTTLPKDEILKTYGLSKGKPVIALLPGSRTSELKTLLPAMLAGARIIDRKLGGVQFIIAKYRGLPRDLYENLIKNMKLDVRIAEGDTYNILGASDFAIVASGTATLETAMIGTPLIIVYKAHPITYLLYKIVSDIKFLGIVNIIAGKEVVPEILQYEMTPDHIAARVVGLMRDEAGLSAMRDELGRVKSSLGSPGASLRAARSILPFLQ
ncbi:MAG: lipid-A-disaccharide synthase [Candidatus Omnitrophica bacterium]|nr:lipid-A-disaccharide synthase [Candidatus Omnitrophota bacterium]